LGFSLIAIPKAAKIKSTRTMRKAAGKNALIMRVILFTPRNFNVVGRRLCGESKLLNCIIVKLLLNSTAIQQYNNITILNQND